MVTKMADTGMRVLYKMVIFYYILLIILTFLSSTCSGLGSPCFFSEKYEFIILRSFVGRRNKKWEIVVRTKSSHFRLG